MVAPTGTDAKARGKRCYRGLAPGKTAKNHIRHFVVHEYRDHAHEDPICTSNIEIGATTLFPMKLHQVLDEIERDNMEHIISWAPHGRCFRIHQPQEFVAKVLPRYVSVLAEGWFINNPQYSITCLFEGTFDSRNSRRFNDS
jgi:HSF-type DNA-binding